MCKKISLLQPLKIFPVDLSGLSLTWKIRPVKQKAKLCLLSQIFGFFVFVHCVHKQTHLVCERFILKIHQNTTNYSYSVDVLVSDRNRNVNSVRIIGCIFTKF